MKYWMFFFFLFIIFPFVNADTVYYSGSKYEAVIVSRIVISGNNKTKEDIILRELTFKTSDTLNYYAISAYIEKSQNNIYNTQLFNFVRIDTARLENEMEFIIMVQERWYLWPYPIFEVADRNFSVWLREQNWNRINYGLDLHWNNLTGRKDEFQFKTILGYAEQYGIVYKLPYINKKNTAGFGISADFKRKKELNYQIINDEPAYFKKNNGYVINNFVSSASLYVRPKLYNRHILKLTFFHSNILDTIVSLNPNYYGNNRPDISYFSAKYSFSRELRDSKIYMLKGYYLKLNIEKTGLGMNDYINNITIKPSFVFSFPIFKKFYFGSGTIGKIDYNNMKNILSEDSNIKNPYFLSEALGFNEIISGYELNVINGSTYFMSKNHIKYELFAPKIGEFKFFKNPKFSKFHYAVYMNLNFDFGYVYSNINGFHNELNNELLFGGGLGIDFVTYYDIVIRLEYSVNRDIGHGIFIHYGSPFFSW